MRLISLTVKGAFIGALAAGAFLTGAIIGSKSNRKKLIEKFKKMQFKKNSSASKE